MLAKHPLWHVVYLQAFLALPLLAHGPGREGFGLREDTIDSLMCIWHSHALQVGGGRAAEAAKIARC